MTSEVVYAILSFLLAWKTVGHVAAHVKPKTPRAARAPKEPTP
jgi:hypothetical protein